MISPEPIEPMQAVVRALIAIGLVGVFAAGLALVKAWRRRR